MSFWRNWELISVLSRREIIGRYRGSIFGIFWSFFNPVFMLAVYTFVFSVVFKARWNLGSESKTEFALVLFAGLMVFNLFAECINRAPGLMLGNVNYVKKVVFPLEMLPWVIILSSLFHFFVSFVVWLLAYMIFVGIPPATVILFPLVLAPLILLVVGLSWFLCSLGVYVRDIGQFIGILTTVLLFVSPIFYPASALPEQYRHLLLLNPLTPIIGMIRDVLYWGSAPDWRMLGIYSIFAFMVAALGFSWFQNTRKGFADVL